MTTGIESGETGLYSRDREIPLWPFLLLSLVLFAAGGVFVGLTFRPEPPPRFVEVDLSDIQGVKNEPPPLGEPNASPSPGPASTPAPTPEPTPEPTQVMTPTPPPAATPEFIKPEPSVAPTPRSSPKPKRTARPPTTRQAATAQPNSAPGASQSVRGSPMGKPGGKGGSKGDFISTPHPEYDATALQRHYQGTGTALITYLDGRIVAVEMTQSTGIPYLDSRTVAWIKNYWKVKPGASGRAILPISWRIQ